MMTSSQYTVSLYYLVITIMCDCLFRLILIAEKKVVYSRFPTPLINRLEKHIVDTSTVLNNVQMEILNLLKSWIENFNCLKPQK